MTTIEYKAFGPGKFPSSVEEWFYSAAMDGTDENDGCEGFGWYRLLLFDDEEIQVDYGNLGGVENVKAAIVHEDDQGFVEVWTWSAANAHAAARRDYQRYIDQFPVE